MKETKIHKNNYENKLEEIAREEACPPARGREGAPRGRAPRARITKSPEDLQNEYERNSKTH